MEFGALKTKDIQKVYDRLSIVYNFFDIFESKAKTRSVELLTRFPAQRILCIGSGTGRELWQIRKRIGLEGFLYSFDLSYPMLSLNHRLSSIFKCQGDASHLPYAEGVFDQIYAAYILDLLSVNKIQEVLSGFYRILNPDGRLVLLYLSEGVNIPSRAIVRLWKELYRVSPYICAGCRPLKLAHLVKSSGFKIQENEVIVQYGVPSEIIVSIKIHE